MDKVPFCPLRKSTKETGTLPVEKNDMFLACLQENCAWFGEDKKCAVAKLAESISSIEVHGIIAATMQV